MLFAATITAGIAFHFPDPLDTFLTDRACIAPFFCHLPARKRQAVGNTFMGNTKLTAGLAPLSTVCLDSSAPRSRVSEQVGQLMQHGAAHFIWRKIKKPGVKLDSPLRPKSAPSRAAHSLVPANTEMIFQLSGTQTADELNTLHRQVTIPATLLGLCGFVRRLFIGLSWRKAKLQLSRRLHHK